MTLRQLSPGESASIADLEHTGARRRRLMELGFVPGAPITALQAAPWGDPVAYGVCGAVIALRREDAEQITITGK